MNEQVPLSVAVITKNEEENLRDCLESVAFARQIVVVDSGSTDETVRIASAFGCQVLTEGWHGFGPQKQLAIDRCTSPWVLVLDADERIPPETARVITAEIARSEGPAGYSFPRRNYFQGRWIRHAGWWPDRIVRLFRRDRGRMTEAKVHEAVVVDGPVEPLDTPIDHLTESRLDFILRKIDRYSTLGAQEAFAAGRTSSVGAALLRAQLTFLQDYLLRGGILDGPQGLTLAVTDGVNKFFKYAKLAELTRQARQAGRRGGARENPEG
jgi:glycosyltransferase involved in cell wall biosynthesis